jgi:hypothetical protein
MIDNKTNRVFTSETYPGRVQEFRYVTQDEATKEFARREAEKKANPGAGPRPAQKAIPAPFPAQEKPGDAPKTPSS